MFFIENSRSGWNGFWFQKMFGKWFVWKYWTCDIIELWKYLLLWTQMYSLSVTVDVFADASPMVVSVLDGYNVCIFAYGQTGTGKTFTMEGSEQNRGVNYRTLKQLFKIAEERKDTFTYSISVSVLEVYNEQIRDLLATSPTSKK